MSPIPRLRVLEPEVPHRRLCEGNPQKPERHVVAEAFEGGPIDTPGLDTREGRVVCVDLADEWGTVGVQERQKGVSSCRSVR